MPARKKLPAIPDYEGQGRSPDRLLVQKSNPLMTLSETAMTLAEFKILDAYLSRIDSHDPEKRFIRLEKGEIENLLGVSQIKPQDLEKRVDNLFQTVTIRDEKRPKGFVKIALFEKAACYQDNDGLWVVDLGASPSAMRYIFNIDSIGYLRYRLKNVVNLTSRYSYVLYLYLENERFRKSWEIDLEELKSMLRCTAETYKQFYRFNDLVLKRAWKELNEKTDCHFFYEPVKKGRTVRAIRFELETNPAAELPPADPDQLSIGEVLEPEDRVGYLGKVLQGEQFGPEDMAIILDELATELPGASLVEQERVLRRAYTDMTIQDRKKPIKGRLNYLRKTIRTAAELWRKQQRQQPAQVSTSSDEYARRAQADMEHMRRMMAQMKAEEAAAAAAGEGVQ